MKENISIILFAALTLLFPANSHSSTLDYEFDSSSLSDAIYSNTEVRANQDAIDYYTVKSGDRIVFMLPLRASLTGFADVEWDNAARTVHSSAGGKEITVKIGDGTYEEGGHYKKMEVAPQIKNNRTYVPISFLEDAFGFWFSNKEEGVVDLFIPNSAVENI